MASRTSSFPGPTKPGIGTYDRAQLGGRIGARANVARLVRL